MYTNVLKWIQKGRHLCSSRPRPEVLIPLKYKLSFLTVSASLVLYKLALDQGRPDQMNCGIDG